MIPNHEWKMIFLLSTALALGVGAVAACVVPWIYCKPPDGDDENRAATGVGDGRGGAHSGPVGEENAVPATNIRINGISYVRVVVPPTSSTDNPSTVPTSTAQDSARTNAHSGENPVIEGTNHQAQAQISVAAVQRSEVTDPTTSGVIISENIRTDDRNLESTAKSNKSQASVSKSRVTDPMTSGVRNSDNIRTDGGNLESTAKTNNSQASVPKFGAIDLTISGVTNSENIRMDVKNLDSTVKSDNSEAAGSKFGVTDPTTSGVLSGSDNIRTDSRDLESTAKLNNSQASVTKLGVTDPTTSGISNSGTIRMDSRNLDSTVKSDNSVASVSKSGVIDLMTSGVSISETIPMDSSNLDSTVKPNNSDASASKSEVTQPSESDLENSGVCNSGLINPGTVRVRVLIKNEGNMLTALPIRETSNRTEESFTEPNNGTLSAISGHLNPDSIEPYDESSESKDMLCSTVGSKVSRSSTTEERSSTTLKTSEASNTTNGSSTETTSRISTSQDSQNFSSGPTTVLTEAVVEYFKNSDTLETIREDSTSPLPSLETSPKIPQQWDESLSGMNRTSRLWVGNEESITSTSTRASKRIDVPSVLPNRTPSVTGTPDSTETSFSNSQDAGIRKSSKGSRSALALFGHIKKICRGKKADKTPRSARSRDDQKSQMQSVKGLFSAKKRPAGQSTVMSEDQRLIESIRTRRSPKTLTPCVLKTYDDPGISNNLNNVPLFGVEMDEEPLDLSPESNKKTEDTSTRRKSLSRSVVEYLKVRKSSKSSEEGITLSDSLMVSGEDSTIHTRDENQNVRSDSLNFGNVKAEDSDRRTGKFDDGTLDSGCLPKSNRVTRSLKKILPIGSKDRSKANKILRKSQVLNTAPVEFQRNSAGASSQLKSDLNAKVATTFYSPTDVSSYYELGIPDPDDDRCSREPCTEL